MKKIIIIVVSLLVTIALGMGLVSLVRSQLVSGQQAKATETAQKFVEALVDNKPEAAYALLDTQAKASLTVAEFKDRYKDAALADPNYVSDTITKLDDKQYGLTRVVSGYPADTEGGNELSYSVITSSESGSWKVRSFVYDGVSDGIYREKDK